MTEKTIRNLLNIFLIALAAAFFSCNQNRVYEKNTEITDGIWNVKNKISFDVPITDTLSINNIYINIRHTGLYLYRNLFLFINTTAPSGASIRDTFEITLADEKGKWLGSGLGDIWDNQILYKRHVQFPYSGTYNFEIEQAMRRENLPFVMDVGLRIEKEN